MTKQPFINPLTGKPNPRETHYCKDCKCETEHEEIMPNVLMCSVCDELVSVDDPQAEVTLPMQQITFGFDKD